LGITKGEWFGVGRVEITAGTHEVAVVNAAGKRLSL
jgi:hypothetical protein